MIEKVIKDLYPNTAFVVVGDKWESLDETEMDSELIVQGIAELEYEIEVQEYQRQRAAAYPNYADQFDQIFHEGIDAWKATIQTIKDAHPKAEIDPDELASRKAQALFNHRLKEYTKAKERLAQYQVALGREETTKEIVISESYQVDDEGKFIFDDNGEVLKDYTTETVIDLPSIDPVEPTVERTVHSDEDPMAEPTIETIENPLITKDNEERAAAQAIIDATPQAVIDAYNGEKK
jgi:hypothetical protein